MTNRSLTADISGIRFTIQGVPASIPFDKLQKSVEELKIDCYVNRNVQGVLEATFKSYQDAERFYAITNGIGIAGFKVILQSDDPQLNYSPTPARVMVVKHMKYRTSSVELYCFCRRYGRLVLCKSMIDRNGIESFGLLQFENTEDAERCLREMDGTTWFGHKIQLSWLLEKKRSSPSSELAMKTGGPAGFDWESLLEKDPYPWDDPRWKTVTRFPPTTGWHFPPDLVESKLSHSRQSSMASSPTSSIQQTSQMYDRTNLYIRNLPSDFTDIDLLQLFRPFGMILSLRVMINDQRESKGFGFVKFSNEEEANSALQALSGRLLPGSDRPLFINFAETKTSRMLKRSISSVPVGTSGTGTADSSSGSGKSPVASFMGFSSIIGCGKSQHSPDFL